ncbi:hypothetical protein [Rheinheimera sp. UJ63]|uniref:hypothetical protein n=1 Tax=Rheinheimera sp. UJ63 TaxID=2910157 RepID=UPI001F1F2847|nr:hypothetical protein [Rheinheimera sp. UJ63]MCF4008708.1 hypothetical protein [Rheinheimera sp. UJ63]
MQPPFDFKQLSKAWQQQPTQPLATDLRAAKRQQNYQRWQYWAELAAAGLLLILGCSQLFGERALLDMFLALFLFAGAISMVLTSVSLHRPLLNYSDWSSQGLLLFRLEKCRTTVRYLRYNQYSCLALLLFVITLWGLAWWQPAQVPNILLQVYSFLVLPGCAWGWWLFGRKRQQAIAKLHHLESLYEELYDAV